MITPKQSFSVVLKSARSHDEGAIAFLDGARGHDERTIASLHDAAATIAVVADRSIGPLVEVIGGCAGVCKVGSGHCL